MSQPVALIVDDEPDIRELLELTLGRMGIATRAVEDLGQAKREVERRSFDLCLTDMRLPDGNGIELIRYIQEQRPAVPVAMITAHGNMESAIEALKAGAFDFVSKPIDLQGLRDLVNAALRLGARGGDHPPRAPDAGGDAMPRLIGASRAMEQTRARIRKLARSQAPVYVSGESGTGKELVARMIHGHGARAEGPFVPVNCGAIPSELMESELFGHMRGSFTGAVADKPGLFQSAQRGTLFLDEVAELPLPMQVKLLRAIQEKSVRPVGAQREVKTDVRILSATHKDLAALVQEGRFRQDLYYRINVIEIHVPALRERPEDIPELAAHILDRLAAEIAVAPPAIAPEAMQRLAEHAFPGNVRELENILERALTLCEGERISAADLGIEAGAGAELPGGAPVELDAELESVEKRRILEALERNRWNKTAAARDLGISFRALRYRLKKLGVD